MPGSVSDSYDPEWGTSAKAEVIDNALREVYVAVSSVLSYREPMDIRDLANADLPTMIGGYLTERQWRLIRFSIERARESL